MKIHPAVSPLIVALLGLTPLAGAQEPGAEAPVFGRDVELVKVDVVVSDKAGNPVTGLKKEDFSLQDEGQPQAISTFDVVQVPAAPSIPRSAPPPRPHLATNMTPKGLPGRSFVIVFDNLHMTPLNAQRAKAAVEAFLDKGLALGDRVTLAATGGGAWWTTEMPEGRADLVALLKGLDGRRPFESSRDRILDFEAMRIYLYSDTQVAARVSERIDKFGGSSRADASSAAQRQADQGAQQSVINPYIDNRAAEVYLKSRSRSRLTLGAIERVLKALSPGTDRKAVILVSEGFVLDTQEEAFRKVSEAARRANAAIYFIDTRGLQALPMLYSAEFGTPIAEGDTMSAIADMSREAEGSETLAQETGGFSVTNSNDLAAGITRIARESRSYYVLSFSPASVVRDGRYHKIEVKVRGRGLVVRARRGYYAPAPAQAPGPVASPSPKGPQVDQAIQQALDSPFFMDAIPIRMTAYVLEERTLGRLRTMVVAETDVSRLDFHETPTGKAGSLDSLLVVAHRDSEEVQRSDERLDLHLRADAKPGGAPIWYSIVREFELSPGGYEAKIVLRDHSSRQIGTVAYNFDVPEAGALRVSTPILTDTINSAQDAVAPVMIARRTFRRGTTLYCRFDVHGAAKSKASGMPRVTTAQLVRTRDGAVISKGAASEIVPTSLGALSRMTELPLEGIPPGDYELVLTVQDLEANRTREDVEPFTVE
jgi:VWFA-related protein